MSALPALEAAETARDILRADLAMTLAERDSLKRAVQIMADALAGIVGMDSHTEPLMAAKNAARAALNKASQP